MAAGKKGGARPGSGRKKGATTFKTREVAERLLSDGKLTPLEYLVSVMRDPKQETSVRVDAAKSAARFMHPTLAAIEHSGADGGPLTVEIVRYATSPNPE